MKKVIDDVVRVPCNGETVRFTSCFVSMLMRALEITDEEQDFYCGSQNGPCIRCGKCDDFIPIERLHNEFYYLYTIVSGYGFVQIDLSDDRHMAVGWDVASHDILTEFDDYVDFTMGFAGYEYEKAGRSDNKPAVLKKIKESVDGDIPVLVRFGHAQWVLVTGYEDDALMGLDGSRSYWGEPAVKPDGYDEGLFVMSDWYENLEAAYILGSKKEPVYGIREVLSRGRDIMESMQARKYYQNSVEFMRNGNNFRDQGSGHLVELRERIAGWIGQPIDIRAMTGFAMNPLKNDESFSRKESIAMHKVHGLCWTVHDVLWIAWFAIGQYKGGDKLEWAGGLLNPVIRNTVADCMDFVCRHDEMMLGALKEAF